MKAAGPAAGLYVLHNVLYAAFSFISGFLADRFDKRRLPAGGYFPAALTALLPVLLRPAPFVIALVFVLGGIDVAVEETPEDSLCAEIVEKTLHGMAFGTLATVNGVGDSASSIVVGRLWSSWGTGAAFGYSAFLFAAGGLPVAGLRLPRNSSAQQADCRPSPRRNLHPKGAPRPAA